MREKQFLQWARKWLLLALVGAAIAGCGPAATPTSAPTEAPTKITFVYSPYTDYAPFFVAEDKGYFDQMGVDVELVPKGGATAETYQMMAAGEVTAGGSTWGCSFFNAVKQGTMVSIIAPMATMPLTGKSPSPLMVSKKAYDSGEVTTVADLKGQKVGIPGPGGFGEYSVMLALKAAGLSIDDVELVNLGPPETGPAMENGSVVASWTIEPFSTFLEREGMAVVLSSDHAKGVELGFLAFSSDFVKANPEATARFTAAYLKANSELAAGGWNDPVIRAIVEKYTELPGDVLSAVGLTVRSEDGSIDLDSVRDQEAYCRERGNLEYEGELDLDSIYSTDVLKRAIELLGD